MPASTSADLAIHLAPLAVAVEEYKKALRTLLPLFVLSLAWLSYIVWRIYEVLRTKGWCLHVRWLIVGALFVAGLVAFFRYGVWQVWNAIRSIRKPCFELVKGQEAGQVVKAIYSERLGNNVFQYSIAMLRSWYLKAGFEAPPLPKPFDSVPFQMSGPPSAGTSHQASPFAAAITDDRRFLFGTGSWLNHPASGYVLNTSLFVGKETEIRRLLKRSLEKASSALGATAQPSFASNDVAIHVRLGDILWGHHCAYRPLPVSFYLRALKEIAASLRRRDASVVSSNTEKDVPTKSLLVSRRGKKSTGSRSPSPSRRKRGSKEATEETSWQSCLGNIILVTEDATHQIITRMTERLQQLLSQTGDNGSSATKKSGWKGRIITQSSSLQEDFLTLYRCPNLVLSISSFAWWAAFLSMEDKSKRKIIVPDYGLLRAHVWFPTEKAYPLTNGKGTVESHEPAPHDMSLRRGAGWKAADGTGEDLVTSILKEAFAKLKKEFTPQMGEALFRELSDCGSDIYIAAKAAVAHAAVFGIFPISSDRLELLNGMPFRARVGQIFRKLWLPTYTTSASSGTSSSKDAEDSATPDERKLLYFLHHQDADPSPPALALERLEAAIGKRPSLVTDGTSKVVQDLSDPLAPSQWARAICTLTVEEAKSYFEAEESKADKARNGGSLRKVDAEAFAEAFYTVLFIRLDEVRSVVLAEDKELICRLPAVPSDAGINAAEQEVVLKRWDGNFRHTTESLFDA
jgi:Glycosyl transferase family 11